MLNLVTLVVAFSPSLFISLAPSFVFAPPHQMDYCNPTYTSSCQRQPCSQWLSTFAHQGPFISAKKYWICLFLRNLKSNHCKLKEFKNNEKIGVKAPICSAVSKKEFWLHPYSYLKILLFLKILYRNRYFVSRKIGF